MKIKHHAFASQQLKDFVVLQERRGKISLFPHTQQLQRLHEALEREFLAPLPVTLSRVGPYSDDSWKIMRKCAAFTFCHIINCGRNDGLILFCLLDTNKVARITIVQQITEHTPLGAVHQFLFYGGPDFIHEVRLSGKRLMFADHVLKRFRERAHTIINDPLGWFLELFFNSHIIGMSINHGNALVLPGCDQFLAFTYEKTESEYFITTCLDQNRVYDLRVEFPAKAFNLHYGNAFNRPKIRNWNPLAEMFNYQAQWRERAPLQPVKLPPIQLDWPSICKQSVMQQREFLGHGRDSRLYFLDDILGPTTIELSSSETLKQFKEAEFLAEYSFEQLQDLVARDPRIIPGHQGPLTREEAVGLLDFVMDQNS